MPTESLKYLLTADDRASAAFARVRGELGRLGGAARGLNTVFGGLGTSLAAGLSVTAIAALTKRTLDGLDALNDLADATGASVENLSALEDIALRTGTSVETMGTALVKLNQALGSAKAGSDAERAINALGLRVAELKALDPVQAFQRIAVALQGYADDGNKARLVQELFGKSLREVAPLLKDAAEAGRLNATVTKEQAAQAEALNKEFFALRKNATDFARAVVSEVVPALNRLFERANKEGWLAALFSPTDVQQAQQRAQDISRGITIVGDAFARAQALSERADLPGAVRGYWKQRAAELRVELESLQRQALSATSALKGLTPDLGAYSNEGRNYPRPGLPDLPGAGGKPKASPKTGTLADPVASQAVIDALKAIEGTDVSRVERLNAALDELFALRAGGLGGDAALDAALENLRDELYQLSPAAQQAAADAARLRAILEQTPTGKQAALAEQIAFVNAQFDAGKIKNMQQWAEAMQVVTGTAVESAERVKEAGKTVAEEIGLVFTSAAGEAIRNFESLRAVLKGVLADILQIGMQRLVTQPLQTLIGGLFEGGGAFAGMFAGGGTIGAGQWGIVGERGPELAYGGASGMTIYPGGGAAGAAVTINQTLNVGAGVSRHEVAAAMVAARDSAVAAVADAQRRGRA